MRQPQKQGKAYPETWADVAAWYKVTTFPWTTLAEHACGHAILQQVHAHAASSSPVWVVGG